MTLGIDMVTRDLAFEIVNLYCEETESYEPTLKLYKKLNPRRPAYIPLPCAWKYDEPDHDIEAAMAVQEVANIAAFLGLPNDKTSLLQILLFIQDKLALLTKAPTFIPKEKVFGQADIIMGGNRFSTDLRN